MQTEELLNRAEAIVKHKFPTGIVGMVSEVYILTTNGDWLCRPYMTRSKRQSRINMAQANLMIAALNLHHALLGVVQVSSGWIVEGALGEPVYDPQMHPKRKEILLFQGKGPRGPRIRIYKVVKKGRRKLVSTLIGAFAEYPTEQGG